MSAPAGLPESVVWFWEQALTEGNVPYVYEDDEMVGVGMYVCDENDTPFVMCPDADDRARFAVNVLRGARLSAPNA